MSDNSINEPKYLHLSQRKQILKRPGQHIGSTKNVVKSAWLAQYECQNGESIVERIIEQDVETNPGLVHIFSEGIDNIQDIYLRNIESAVQLKRADIDIDQETGRVTIWNDGPWISTRIHEWTKDEEVIDSEDHYEAEILFGHLNSSGNYDDEEHKRVGGGLHGHGIKLTNIFSKEFSVETFDPESGLRFQMTWRDNMSTHTPAKITSLKQKRGYTQISFIADFELFGVQGYTDIHLAIMKKKCIDCAMITGQKIFFNGEQIPVRNLSQYVQLYNGGISSSDDREDREDREDCQAMEFKSSNASVILSEKPSDQPGFSQISFVNGIFTAKGGIHVDVWKDAIFKPLLEKIVNKFSRGKSSSPVKITRKHLEQYFRMFISCNVENPEFNGQTKEILNGPEPETNVSPGKIANLMKWGFMEDIEETIKLQGMKELQKSDGKKSQSVNIPKANDANKAGGAKSLECTLFITEGDSAKAFAVKGISSIENGTDWYGILPVRGKVLNVRGASVEQINNNVEICNLKRIVGLRNDIDYSDESSMKTLRYGKIRILTDADYDGDHIKGLIINYFQYFHPDLIECKFIATLRTPIVKATIGSKTINFYYLKQFKDWAARQTANWTAKYYKGLGTSTDAEILEIFENPRNVQFVADAETADTVAMVFDKKRANERKKWLENYQEHDFIYKERNGEEQVPVSSFFNNEMIEFSLYDNQRSIPSVVDGLKPSQRKALHVGLKILKKDLKVAQFGARVAEAAEYHHGEASMFQTIIGMAQTFVGANNIALFHESGQFGTRLIGGKDAAAPRYIYTRLASIARYIFRKEDDPILEYLEEDGKKIEPKFFVPIIPMLLVNGSVGIGFGWSTTVPCYNPLDLVEWIRIWIADGNANGAAYPDLIPWYWGFKGTVTPTSQDKYSIAGNVRKVDGNGNVYEITELPVGVWTDDYKDLLNELKSGTAKPTKNSKRKKAGKKGAGKGYEGMTVSILKAELGARGLPMTGTKNMLIEKLKKYDKENGTSAKNLIASTANEETTDANANGSLITKMELHGDAYNVNFKVWTKPNVEITLDNPRFKLTSTVGCTNMIAFMPTGGLKEYASVNDILETFCNTRFEYYQARKKYALEKLLSDLAEAETKAKFIAAVLDDFTLLKQSEEQLFMYLEQEGYWKRQGGNYKYLTEIPIRTCTNDHYEKLLKEIDTIKKDIEYIKKISPKQMWLKELDEFCVAYEKWKGEMEKLHEQLAKKKIKRLRQK